MLEPVSGASTHPAMAHDLPFRYLGKDASLDFVNTVDWAARGLVNERLTGYERLTRWAEGVGVLSRADAERLRMKARARPSAARDALRRALQLRSVIQGLYRSVALDATQPSVWNAFNRALAGALPSLRLQPRSARRRERARADWTWSAAGERLDVLLVPVVWSAAKLVTSDEARRIRICADRDCGWMYLDRSRNGLRRWCAMETCGTKAKSRRRRERSAVRRSA